MTVREVLGKDEKEKICIDILHALPDWFAVEESVLDYAQKAREQRFFAAFADEKPVGFLSVKHHNPYTAEVYVMGVLPGFHRGGAGSALMQAAETSCKAEGIRFLTVKTLDSSAEYEPYEQTRSFYRKMGFLPLEVFTELWDADNPCLFMAKYLGAESD